VKVRPGSLYQAVYEITGALHEFPQFAVALPEVHILGDDAAAAAVDDRVGTLEAWAAEIWGFEMQASRPPDTWWCSITC
jgi:hypothetical protein